MVWEHNPFSMWMTLLGRAGMTPNFPFHAIKRNVAAARARRGADGVGLPLAPLAVAYEGCRGGARPRRDDRGRGAAVESRPMSSPDIHGHTRMNSVKARQAISLDGYTAGPNQGPDNPLGEGGMRLMQWQFASAAWHACRAGPAASPAPTTR